MTNNPRLLAIRHSTAACVNRVEMRERMEAWLMNPTRMHYKYRIPGARITQAEIKQSKRVLTLWLATFRD